MNHPDWNKRATGVPGVRCGNKSYCKCTPTLNPTGTQYTYSFQICGLSSLPPSGPVCGPYLPCGLAGTPPPHSVPSPRTSPGSTVQPGSNRAAAPTATPGITRAPCCTQALSPTLRPETTARVGWLGPHSVNANGTCIGVLACFKMWQKRHTGE